MRSNLDKEGKLLRENVALLENIRLREEELNLELERRIKVQRRRKAVDMIFSTMLILAITFVIIPNLLNPDNREHIIGMTSQDKDKHYIKLRRILNTKISKDTLVVYNNRDSNKRYLQRVMGVPGDTIAIKDGMLFINENKKRYVLHEDLEQILTNAEYLLLSDNNADKAFNAFIVNQRDITSMIVAESNFNLLN